MEFDLDWRRETSATWPDVSYEIRPLKVWAFHQLLDFWGQSERSDSDALTTGKINPSDGVRLIEIAARIFPDHVRALEGIRVKRDDQVGAPSIEMLCEETQFLPLAGEIVSRLVAVSEIGSQDEKN